MPSYVVIEFQDDEDARQFVRKTIAKGDTAWAKVRGVFRKPTLFCTNDHTARKGFVRGTKYGWWVCDKCGKPMKLAQEQLDKGFRMERLGFNLLPPEITGELNRAHMPKTFIEIAS